MVQTSETGFSFIDLEYLSKKSRFQLICAKLSPKFVDLDYKKFKKLINFRTMVLPLPRKHYWSRSSCSPFHLLRFWKPKNSSKNHHGPFGALVPETGNSFSVLQLLATSDAWDSFSWFHWWRSWPALQFDVFERIAESFSFLVNPWWKPYVRMRYFAVFLVENDPGKRIVSITHFITHSWAMSWSGSLSYILVSATNHALKTCYYPGQLGIPY